MKAHRRLINGDSQNDDVEQALNNPRPSLVAYDDDDDEDEWRSFSVHHEKSNDGSGIP